MSAGFELRTRRGREHRSIAHRMRPVSPVSYRADYEFPASLENLAGLIISNRLPCVPQSVFAVALLRLNTSPQSTIPFEMLFNRGILTAALLLVSAQSVSSRISKYAGFPRQHSKRVYFPKPATDVKEFTTPTGVKIRYKEPGKAGVCETTPGKMFLGVTPIKTLLIIRKIC